MSSRGRRGLARSAIAVLIVVVCLPAVATASAQTTGVRVDARGGFDGVARRNAPVPLTILVESDRFFAGAVQVVLNGPTQIERAIELPGGSRKELLIVVPRPNILEVRVVDRAGRVVAKRQPGINQIQNEPLIGVLAAAPPAVTQTTISPIDLEASVVAVPPAFVELGVEALDALSHLVVDAKTVSALSPRQRETVIAFAAAGGELVVAAASESDLGFLPAARRGSGGGDLRRTALSAGFVTVALRPLSDSAWSSGGSMWSQAIRPVDLGRWSGAGESPSQEWLEAITQSGGFRGTPLGWLLAFLIGYVALVGPVNFVVLGRLRRRELAWITVPLLALLFAGGAYAAGRGTRNAQVLHGAGIVVLDDSSRRDEVAVAILSRGGGEQTIRLGGSWLTDPLPFMDGSNQSPVVRGGRDASEVTFPLAIGAVGTLAARRVSLTPSAPVAVLKGSGGGFTGTVRNPLDVTLRNAGVILGTSFVPVEPLEPGAERNVTVHVGAGQQIPIEISVEEHFFRTGNPEDLGAIFPLIRRASTTIGLGDPGRAFLVGFADFKALARPAGIDGVSGTALVAMPLRLDVGDAASLSSNAIRRSVVSTDGFFEPSAGPFEQIFETREVVLRFDLPGGRKASSMEMNAQQLGFFGGRGPIIVKPVPGAPPDLVGQGGGIAMSMFDFKRGRWQTFDTKDGLVRVSSKDASRYQSPAGELYVRLSSDFPQVIPTGAFGLTAELA